MAEAALPYTSGGHQGIPAALTHELAAWRTAVAGGDQEALTEILPSLLQAAAAAAAMPDTSEGHRLATALRPYSTPVSVGTAARPVRPPRQVPVRPPRPVPPSRPRRAADRLSPTPRRKRKTARTG